MLGALGVRMSFSRSFVGGVVTFWPICWSMTSQAAGRGYRDYNESPNSSVKTKLTVSQKPCVSMFMVKLLALDAGK